MPIRDLQAIAEALFTARRHARPLAGFPGELPGSLEEAYRVQEEAIALGIALGGRHICGWKVAGIHPDLRATYGAERMAGPVYADVVHDLPAGGRTRVTVIDGGFAALEAEFVARLGRDLVPGPDGFTAELVLAAVASLHAGSEVASSPLARINEIGPIGVVCDHGNNAGAVVGPELPEWRTRPLESLTSQMLIDGVPVGSGSAALVMGGPLAAVKFLAENLAARGRHLGKGDIVLTGMTTGIHAVRPGSRGRLVFSGVPDCELEVVAASGYGN